MADIKEEEAHAQAQHQSLILVDDDSTKPSQEASMQKRVDSLDIFRGFTVSLMILVDDAGGEWPMITHAPWNGCNLADFVMPFFLFIVGMAIPLALKRIPNWHMAAIKVIFRTFKLLFWGILLQGGYSHAPDKLTYGVDMKKVRWCGILQRIALAYLVVSLVEIATKTSRTRNQSLGRFSVFKLYFWQWFVGACVLVIYLSVLYGVYVPDWQFTVQDPSSPDFGKHFTVVINSSNFFLLLLSCYRLFMHYLNALGDKICEVNLLLCIFFYFVPSQVKCGVRGKLDPSCNAVGFVDRQVLGINHLYNRPAWKRSKACTEKSPYEGPFLENAPSWCHAPFEPEGILSSISAILSTIIGVHYGHVLIHLKDHAGRLKHWVSLGLVLLIFGIVLHFTNAIPLNKQLYSLSYVCVTSGAAALVFSSFYSLVDILDVKFVFLPFKWIGMNAMLVYVMAAEGIFAGFINGWYYDDPHNTLVYWIQKHVFIGVWHSRKVGILLYVIFAEILFWAIVSGILHQFKIYWKL